MVYGIYEDKTPPINELLGTIGFPIIELDRIREVITNLPTTEVYVDVTPEEPGKFTEGDTINGYTLSKNINAYEFTYEQDGNGLNYIKKSVHQIYRDENNCS